MWRSILAFAGDPEVASDAVAEAFTFYPTGPVVAAGTRGIGAGRKLDRARDEKG